MGRLSWRCPRASSSDGLGLVPPRGGTRECHVEARERATWRHESVPRGGRGECHVACEPAVFERVALAPCHEGDLECLLYSTLAIVAHTFVCLTCRGEAIRPQQPAHGRTCSILRCNTCTIRRFAKLRISLQAELSHLQYQVSGIKTPWNALVPCHFAGIFQPLPRS